MRLMLMAYAVYATMPALTALRVSIYMSLRHYADAAMMLPVRDVTRYAYCYALCRRLAYCRYATRCLRIAAA